MREDGQGDAARATLGLRPAWSWGLCGCWGEPKEAQPGDPSMWTLPAAQEAAGFSLGSSCYPGGKEA